MDTVLTQQDIPEQGGSRVFASDPATNKERPGSPYYDEGVEVRYTAPEPWWNWFWNLMTSFLKKHKEDNQALITEERNLLTAASITPDSTDTHHIAKSMQTIAENYSEVYDNQTVVENGVERPVNKPYIQGDTIILPDTELL